MLDTTKPLAAVTAIYFPAVYTSQIISTVTTMEEQNAPPIFSAVSNSAHQLYILLRCISFASKAFVQITPDGIRFSVEEGRVMQGLAFLDKALFTNYIFNPPPSTSNNDSDEEDGGDDSSDNTVYPRFLISLSALLETLQIFGISDPPILHRRTIDNRPEQPVRLSGILRPSPPTRSLMHPRIRSKWLPAKHYPHRSRNDHNL